ncbi:MAG TPA: ABC transporter ATP-binding protein [Ktedonobacteraceae bacterium]
MSEEDKRPKSVEAAGVGPMGKAGWGALGRPAQRARDFKGTFQRLLGYVAPHTPRLLIVLIAAVLGTVFTILAPKILGLATTRLFTGLLAKYRAVQLHRPVPALDFGTIGRILLLLLVLYVFSAIFLFVQQYVMAAVAQQTVYQLRKEVDEKLARLPLAFFDAYAHGEILSRAVNDMDTLSSTLQQSVTQVITSAVSVLGVVVMMLTISWQLSLVVLATLPLCMLIATRVAQWAQGYFRQQQNTLGVLNGHVEQMYTGHQVVKAYGHEEHSIALFTRLNEQLYAASWRAQCVSGLLMPLMMFVGNLCYVCVAVLGSILVTGASLAIGDVQAFIQYAQQFTQPIAMLANIANVIQSSLASAERIFELLDEPEELPDAAAGLPAPGPRAAAAVQFQHVRFGYSGQQTLMEDMNIDVQPGQMVAIVGPTGAGKTTLVNLLLRFYEIEAGRILVNGVDIAHLRRADLRRTFGLVLQDTWLFSGTVRQNIAYGREQATEAEIVQAARAAFADHFIRTLPAGYDTLLSEDAFNISQGQRQLLTIARAFLADPEILILDEATSNVDTRTELLIQQAMSELMRGRTSFVIAHRLSTIRYADLILVMRQGSIVEKNTHDGLLASNGFYAELYRSQFAHRGQVGADR